MNPLPILQHPEPNRILPADVLLLRIDPNIQVIRNQVIVSPILPIRPPQQIQPCRRHLRIIHLRRSRRRRAHLLLRTLPRRRLHHAPNKPQPSVPRIQPEQNESPPSSRNPPKKPSHFIPYFDARSRPRPCPTSRTGSAGILPAFSADVRMNKTLRSISKVEAFSPNIKLNQGK